MHLTLKRLAACLILLAAVISVPVHARAEEVKLPEFPQLHCDAFYMVNTDTGTVVYEQNADKQKYPASLTKVMTALIALESYPDPSSVTVEIKGSVMGNAELNNQAFSTSQLKTGEHISMVDLLYCALVSSDNYAAQSIGAQVSADFGDGSVEWFIGKMNERAAALGCTGTHFANTHGLENAQHYTTAADMYRIAAAAMKYPLFAEIVSTVSYTRPATDLSEPVPLNTTNFMMVQSRTDYYYGSVRGVKTGYIQKAGHCLVSCASENNYSYMLVALDDKAERSSSTNYAFIDSKELYKWAFGSFHTVCAASPGELIAEVPLELALDREALLLTPAESFTYLLPANVSAKDIYTNVDIPEKVTAPVEKGDVIGKAYFTYNGEIIGSVDLLAADSVERSRSLAVSDKASSFFRSPVLWGIVGSVVIVFGLSILYALWDERRRRMKRRKAAMKKRSGGTGAKRKR